MGKQPYEIPDYKVYKVEGIKELEMYQKALAKRGLKDPWIRNEVWRYYASNQKNAAASMVKFMFTGFKWGLAATVLTLGIEAVLNFNKPPHHSSDHH